MGTLGEWQVNDHTWLELTSPSLAQTGNTTPNIRTVKSETTKSKVYKSKTC